MTRAVDGGAQVGVFDLDLGPGPTGRDVAYGIPQLIRALAVVYSRLLHLGGGRYVTVSWREPCWSCICLPSDIHMERT